MGARNMREFQNKVLRNVLLSVFQLPAPSFFGDTRFNVFHRIISALNVLWFYIFHDPVCSITTSAEVFFVMYCTCKYFHCTIHYMRATYITKVKCSAVKEHTRAMRDKTPFGRPGTTRKIMKLYNHTTLHTLLIM